MLPDLFGGLPCPRCTHGVTTHHVSRSWWLPDLPAHHLVVVIMHSPCAAFTQLELFIKQALMSNHGAKPWTGLVFRFGSSPKIDSADLLI